MRKRSVLLRGHATSVSVEDAYWAELKRMARDGGVSLSALIASVDDGQRTENLSSALRLAVLEDLKAKLAKDAVSAL